MAAQKEPTTRKKRIYPDKAMGDRLAPKLVGLVASGKTLDQIHKKLNLTSTSFETLLRVSQKFSDSYKDARSRAPHNAGAPEIYTKDYGDRIAHQIPEMFARGESVAEVSVALGFSKATFYKLVSVSPAFAEAYEEGKTRSEAFWTKLGRGGAAGAVKINAAVWGFTMKNAFGWADKIEHRDVNKEPPAPTMDMDSLSTETLAELAAARG